MRAVCDMFCVSAARELRHAGRLPFPLGGARGYCSRLGGRLLATDVSHRQSREGSCQKAWHRQQCFLAVGGSK